MARYSRGFVLGVSRHPTDFLLQPKPLAGTIEKDDNTYRPAFYLRWDGRDLLLFISPRSSISHSMIAMATAHFMHNSSDSAPPSSAEPFAKMRPFTEKPFLRAEWLPTVFINFLVSPDVLKPLVPAELELDLYDSAACVSLVAVTMRRFQPCRRGIMGCLTGLVREQRFLNLRTYVKWRNEPGALFLHGWLSQPLAIPLPSGLLGLPYHFSSSNYAHQLTTNEVAGKVSQDVAGFAYSGSLNGTPTFQPCPPGSLAGFALERYAGFFRCGKETRIFRVWHPPWLQQKIEFEIEDMSLLSRSFPWIRSARLAGAILTQGFPNVFLGKARALTSDIRHQSKNRRHRLGVFFEMP